MPSTDTNRPLLTGGSLIHTSSWPSHPLPAGKGVVSSGTK
jgi:hypothetical protein